MLLNSKIRWLIDKAESVMLDITNVNALAQRSNFIGLGRNKLLRHKTLVSSFYNSCHDSRVVKFLSIVYFMAARNSSSVIVRNILLILFNGGNDVAFHNLHVIDIIQQFEPVGTNFV